MAARLALLALASLATQARSESLSLTEANWNAEITERVIAGQFVLVKFQAPW